MPKMQNRIACHISFLFLVVFSLHCHACGDQGNIRVVTGEVKNTRKYSATLDNGERINVIPDAVTDDRIIEIKDTKVVNFTKQIQGELDVARKQGKTLKLITGENTHISQPLKQLFDRHKIEIERRPDLGPQQ